MSRKLTFISACVVTIFYFFVLRLFLQMEVTSHPIHHHYPYTKNKSIPGQYYDTICDLLVTEHEHNNMGSIW